VTVPTSASVPVRIWVDPSCPWAWQTVRWLLELRDRDEVELSWSLFSLELNSSPKGTSFREATPRHGRSLATLALARDEGGGPAFEALYLALGTLLHEAKREPSPELLHEAAVGAGLGDLPERVDGRPDLDDRLVDEYADARRLDVFGVPTLGIADHKVVYGPIVAHAPTGEEALSLWRDVRAFAERDDLFELKRWPRDVRPGEPARRAEPRT
jgi:predicted DsbA family dithiol-disulfide isomerase